MNLKNELHSSVFLPRSNHIPEVSLSKKIAILQSNYIPWKGYFDLIHQVDELFYSMTCNTPGGIGATETRLKPKPVSNG